MIQLIVRLRTLHSTILKTSFDVQEEISLYSLSESHFQTLLGHKNRFRRGGKQDIQGLRCINSLITRNAQEWFKSSKNIRIYR